MSEGYHPYTPIGMHPAAPKGAPAAVQQLAEPGTSP